MIRMSYFPGMTVLAPLAVFIAISMVVLAIIHVSP